MDGIFIDCTYERTAMHEAVSVHSMSVVRYLVRIGADTGALNEAGESPRDLAKRVGIPEEEIESYFGTCFVYVMDSQA